MTHPANTEETNLILAALEGIQASYTEIAQRVGLPTERVYIIVSVMQLAGKLRQVSMVDGGMFELNDKEVM